MTDYTFLSWNVNGIRAVERKKAFDFLKFKKYNFISLQETKVHSPDLLSNNLQHPNNYYPFWNCANERKGYSGVVTFSSIKPKKITTNFGKNLLSTEGRMVSLEFDQFYLLNVYFPNGGGDDSRLVYKLKFFDEFIKYFKKLDELKPVIICGDVNIAHQEIDLARPKENKNSIGFLPEEREKLDLFNKVGLVDVFRYFYPTKTAYTWWDQKTRARERNVGWRIDYFWISKRLVGKVKKISIEDKIIGSDHAPIGMTIEF